MHLFLIILAITALITAEDGYKAAEVINEGRRAFAKKYNVANMNELEPSIELARYTMLLEKKCLSRAELIADKRYEVIPMKFVRQGGSAEFLGETFMVNPGQTMFGFTDNRPRCGNIDYDSIYVLGPLNGPAHFKEGTPGSRCDDSRVNRNGLCAKK